MPRHATQPTTFTGFLHDQDPNESVYVPPFSLPAPWRMCRYNNFRCGNPCGLKRNGEFYSKCDYHREIHNGYERAYVQRRTHPYRVAPVDDALSNANDPNALWSDERAFGSLVNALPETTTEFTTYYTDTDDVRDDVLDGIDLVLARLE